MSYPPEDYRKIKKGKESFAKVFIEIKESTFKHCLRL